jgi:hypothetical protein
MACAWFAKEKANQSPVHITKDIGYAYGIAMRICGLIQITWLLGMLGLYHHLQT